MIALLCSLGDWSFVAATALPAATTAITMTPMTIQ
jgi:hypothetical protein